MDKAYRRTDKVSCRGRFAVITKFFSPGPSVEGALTAAGHGDVHAAAVVVPVAVLLVHDGHLVLAGRRGAHYHLVVVVNGEAAWDCCCCCSKCS